VKRLICFSLLLTVVLCGGMKGSEPKMPESIRELLTRYTCITCHDPYKRIVGPPFVLVAKRNYSAQRIAELIANPVPSDWPGFPPMTPLPNVPYEDVVKIANWINSLQ
jgi:cytochrome c